MRVLDVWWDGRNAGRLTQDDHGDLSFAYARDWVDDPAAQPLSASLAKRLEPFSRRECRPFFGGLLPDEGQREAAARALGVSPANDFSLLDRLGGDVAGALQLLPPGEHPPTPSAQHPRAPLTDEALIRILDELPIRPMLAGEDGLRLSLAGAQSKVPVVLVQDTIALPLPNQATTHILKPPIVRLPATTENEALVMRLARAVGLDAAPVEARVVRDRIFLLVTRYDRRIDDAGLIRRIQQEDFCQALGVPPEQKYAAEGGPVLKQCFELLRRVAAKPAPNILKMLNAVIFNAIAGNADAHGKNFSILYDGEGARLAPPYDLMSTVVYPELSRNFAMSIGKCRTLEELDAKGWAAFAVETGLGLVLIRRRVGELCDQVNAHIDQVAHDLAVPGLNQAAIAELARSIKDRAAWCARSIAK